MTGVAELISELRKAGVRLWLAEGLVRYRAPAGNITDDLLAALRRHEAALREWLDPFGSETMPHIPDAPSYETSYAQRRLWLLHQLAPLSAAYNVPLHQLLKGPLDRAALERAIDLVVARHEALRTRFSLLDGELRQIVVPARHCDVDYRELSDCPDPMAEARRIGHEFARLPFDLAAGPLCRVGLLRLAPQRHVLLLTVHHIVADGISLAIIAADLARCYEAVRDGKPNPLSSLRLQYRDFAAWQNRQLFGTVGLADRDYWRGKIGGPLASLDLVEDLRRPPVRAFRGHEVVISISPERTAALRDLAQRQGASLFMALVAVLKVLLHRCTGKQDTIIGTLVAGRTHADLEDQVGFFLNTLALRDTVEPAMSFAALLSRVRTTAIEAYEHQTYPFERLVEELNVPRDPSRSPVFDVMAILQNPIADMPPFGGLTAQGFFDHTHTAKFDLSFNFKEHQGGLLLGIEYDIDLFVEARVRCMAEQFLALLDSAVADPACAVSRLPLLSSEERRRVVIKFNRTDRDYPLGATVAALFEEQAQRMPQAAAVRQLDKTLRYAELNALANRIASWLCDKSGFSAGDRALIELPCGAAMLASLLAVLKLRGSAILLEPGLPAARRAQIAAESSGRTLICSTSLNHLKFAGAVLEVDESITAVRMLAADPPSSSPGEPNDIALIFFTSGSTGRPKGVPISNRAILNLLYWFREHFVVGADDVLPQKTPVTFVDAIVELLLPITLAGGCVEFPPEDKTKRDPDALASWLTAIRPTVLQFVPAVFDQFAAETELNALISLRALILSGAIASRPVPGPFRTYNLYGCSECTALSTHYEMTAASPLARIPIGRPLANTQIYILDPEGQPCPRFVPGEICIGGAMVGPGYLGDPLLSAERFVASPLGDGERLFRTGDWGRWLADGTIDFLGRIDQQVKIRGMRIESAEVERALAEHPGIREAAVVSRDGTDGEPELVAYVVAPAEAVMDSVALRRHLAEFLPDPMVPRRFVALDALPRTPSGKIDRNALPVPMPMTSRLPGTAPRDELEQAITDIWRDVLGVPAVGIDDDFLELGGHSLTAARIVSRLHRDLGAKASIVDLFRSMTVAGLTALVRTRSDPPDRIRPIDPVWEIAPLTAEELKMLEQDSA